MAAVVFVTNYQMLTESMTRAAPSKVDTIELRDVDYKTSLEVWRCVCSCVRSCALVAVWAHVHLRAFLLAYAYGRGYVNV